MRALRMGIPVLYIKPEPAYPAPYLAPPVQERPYPPRCQANEYYGAKTAGRQQKQAQQKIVKGHAHGSSSFHSMDMVPLRGSRDGTQRRERANLMADSSAPLLPEDSSSSTWEGTPHTSTTTKNSLLSPVWSSLLEKPDREPAVTIRPSSPGEQKDR